MKVVALKSFRGRYGQIRQGTQFECDPSYFEALRKLRPPAVELAPEHPAQKQTEHPGPADNRNIPAAPNPGKDQPGDAGTPGATDPRKVGGKVLTSRSLRADLQSRAKTFSSSAAGATKTTTPGA